MRLLKLKNGALEEKGLADLLKLCEHEAILDSERHHLSQFIRSYRNLIHPGLQSRKKMRVQEAEAIIAIQAVKSIAGMVAERLTVR